MYCRYSQVLNTVLLNTQYTVIDCSNKFAKSSSDCSLGAILVMRF
jgi:hypothetical protein